MYINITGSANNKDVYIYSPTAKKTAKLHPVSTKSWENSTIFSNNSPVIREKLMAWAEKKPEKKRNSYNQHNGKVTIDFSQGACIAMNELRSFHIGYLFLQCLCTQLRIDKICRTIKSRHKFKYDLNAILTDLVYARILSPCSKLGSYEYCRTLLEPPKYSLQDMYRSLSVLAEESDFIQSELYRNSNYIHPRNKRILYYDCTNYYLRSKKKAG